MALKPKANAAKAICSADCRKIARARTSEKFQRAGKHIAIRARHEAKPERKAYLVKWRKGYIGPYNKRRRAENPEIRIRASLRARLGNVLSGHRKTASTLAYLGCTVAELRAYLEKQFKPGMTWANYGRVGWHIDHRRPMASFLFFNPDGSLNEEALRQSMHFTNLQPLWYWENVSKSDNFVAI